MAAALLVGFLFTPATAAQAGGGKTMIVYQITWEGENVEGELVVNDFPIARFHGAQAFGGMPLNPYLVGENEVRAEVRKKDTTGPGRLRVGVSAMAQGEIASTHQAGSLLSMEIPDSELKPALTVKAAQRFRAPLDFSSHLGPGETVGGNQAVEYAKTLYGLFQAKMIDDLMREFEVKIADFARAYPGHDFPTEFRSVLAAMLRGKLASVDFNRVRARKRGPGGRVWQILEGKEELIRVTAPDGTESEMAIFTGVVDGRLRVVR